MPTTVRKAMAKPGITVGKKARIAKVKPVETEQEPIEWWVEGWRSRLR
jgi:hypothetical protein